MGQNLAPCEPRGQPLVPMAGSAALSHPMTDDPTSPAGIPATPAGAPAAAVPAAAAHTHPHAHRPVRSFVVRAGRMGSGQERALRELGPRFVLPYRPGATDWDAAFGRSAPRVVEIGFGMGQATAQIAADR